MKARALKLCLIVLYAMTSSLIAAAPLNSAWVVYSGIFGGSCTDTQTGDIQASASVQLSQGCPGDGFMSAANGDIFIGMGRSIGPAVSFTAGGYSTLRQPLDLPVGETIILELTGNWFVQRSYWTFGSAYSTVRAPGLEGYLGDPCTEGWGSGYTNICEGSRTLLGAPFFVLPQDGPFYIEVVTNAGAGDSEPEEYFRSSVWVTDVSITIVPEVSTFSFLIIGALALALRAVSESSTRTGLR